MLARESIRKYIAQHMLFSEDGYPYSDDTSFLEEGVIDSLGFMELVTFVRQNFSIEVDSQDLVPENFDSITKLTRYINSKQIAAKSKA
jgi:acyl carrier protein